MRRVNSGRQGPTSLPWTGEHLEHFVKVLKIMNTSNLTFLDSILKMAKSTMSNQKIMQKEVAKGLIIVQVHTHCYWQTK